MMADRLLLDARFLTSIADHLEALDDLISDDDEIAISALTLAELRHGAAGRTAAAKARSAFVQEVLQVVSVVGYDQRTAEIHAELAIAGDALGASLSTSDLVVAATAVGSDRTLITVDKSVFDGLPGLTVRTP